MFDPLHGRYHISSSFLVFLNFALKEDCAKLLRSRVVLTPDQQRQPRAHDVIEVLVKAWRNFFSSTYWIISSKPKEREESLPAASPRIFQSFEMFMLKPKTYFADREDYKKNLSMIFYVAFEELACKHGYNRSM